MGDEHGVGLGLEGMGLGASYFARKFSVRDNRPAPYARGRVFSSVSNIEGRVAAGKVP